MTRGRLTIFLLFTLTLVACASVLGLKRPSLPKPFAHRTHVLRGVNCIECHTGILTAEGEGPLNFPPTEKCVQCHTQPHDKRTCSDCHGSSHTRQSVTVAREHLRFEHKRHAAETKGQCVRCHSEIGNEQPEVMRPTMAACFSCHQHKDQWTARDCDGCHKNLTAEHVRPESHVIHDGDWIREHGVRSATSRDLCTTCHTDSFCAKCHGQSVPALSARLAFDSPTLQGLHRAGFRTRHSMEARGTPGLCATCHTERSCNDCHEREHVSPKTAGGRNPHPAGWLTTRGGQHGRAAQVDPIACAACHSGGGEALCIGCHRVGGPGGNPHKRNFNSNKDKRDVPCRACHVP